MDGLNQISCYGMACPDQQGGIRSQNVSENIFSAISDIVLSLGAGAAINRKTTSKTP
jgi:hypothetical protein